MDLTEIFKTILSLSFMGTTAAGIIILIKVLFKNKFNASWHYYIWALLIIRLVIPYAPESSFSVFNLVHPSSEISQLSQYSDKRVTTETTYTKINDNAAINSNINNIEVMNADKKSIESKSIDMKNEGVSEPQRNNLIFSYKSMSILWVMGAAVMLIYIAAVYTKFILKINKQPKCTEKNILILFEECKTKMNVKINVPIVYERTLNTPTLIGLIRPKLLISPEVIDNLSVDEKKYVFLHELSHLKRKDILINWVMVLVQALHWFNPFIWYSFYKIREDCEVACDAYVLSQLKPAEYKSYGETIINLLKDVSKSYRIPLTAGIANNKSTMKRRIKMIAMFKKKAHIWSLIAIVLTMFVGCGVLTNSMGSNKRTDISAQEKNKSHIEEINIDRLMEYKDSYVGDNSAVGGILNNLPGVPMKGFELGTDSEPYSIKVKYGYHKLESILDDDRKIFKEYWDKQSTRRIFLNNATTLFILVKNVDEVKFNLETYHLNKKDVPSSFSISRKELEDFYGRDLREYAKDKELWEKEILEDTLKSHSKVDNFFKTHNKEIPVEEKSKTEENSKIEDKKRTAPAVVNENDEIIDLDFDSSASSNTDVDLSKFDIATKEDKGSSIMKFPTVMNNSIKFRFLKFNGTDTITTINLKKDQNINMKYNCTIESGKFNILIQNSNYEIVQLFEANKEEDIDFKVPATGEYIIRAVAEKAYKGNAGIKFKVLDVDTAAEEKDNETEKDIKLYFADDNYEYQLPEVRKMKNPTPKSVLEEVMKGPTDPKLHGTMSDEIEILSVEVKDKIAYVNFAKSIHDIVNVKYSSSASSYMFMNSMINTLTLCDEFEIDKVQLLIEGKKELILGQMCIDEPFGTRTNSIKE